MSNRKRQAISADRLTSAVFHSAGTIEGYVFDSEEPGRRFVVELWLDGWPCQVRRADLVDSRSPLAPKDMEHGFCFSLPDPCLAREAEVRVANTSIVLGGPQDLSTRRPSVDRLASFGRVEWRQALVVEGYLSDSVRDDRRVRGFIEETMVFDVATCGWTYVSRGDNLVPVRRFEAHLPGTFADGRVHRLDVLTNEGQPLAGSPLNILAFADGLEAYLLAENSLAAERLRGRFFDVHFPRSIPLEWIDEWTARFPLQPAPDPSSTTVAIVVVGEHDIERSVASLDASETPWVLGVMPSDEETLQFDTADLLAFLNEEAAACSTIIFAVAGTRFETRAAAHVAGALTTADGLAFCDIILEGADSSPIPIAYASFDPELLLEQGAGALLLGMTRATALTAACEPKMSLFDLLIHGYDAVGETSPVHVPGYLASCPKLARAPATAALARASTAHMNRHGAPAKAEATTGSALPAVRIMRTSAAERVTVLIAMRNQLEQTRASVDAIRSIRSRHGIDLHVVDMVSSDEATAQFLKGLTGHHQHVSQSCEPFNVARALNRAVGDIRSRYLLFLEPGCRFEATDWIDELIGRCFEPDVAAAGPLLVTKDEIVEAAGLVLGPDFSFAAAFAGVARDDPGYADLLRVARSCAALPLAGLMTKRTEFLAVGGFDSDKFGRHLLNVDYCLKLGARGKRLVVTPHARLTVPRGSAFIGDPTERDERKPGISGELHALRSIWGEALVSDPRYSRSLALTGRPFSALAWPPRRDSLHATKSPRETSTTVEK